MKTVGKVIEKLEKDNRCSKYMLDWILARIDDLEYGGTGWELAKLKNGYELHFGKTQSFEYLYNQSYQPL